MNINRSNYEEYFISYIENVLSDAERLAVESFVNENIDLKNELRLFQQTKLVVDEKIIFANKERLLHKHPTKIIAGQWSLNTWAVAAMLLLAVGLGWWMFSGKWKVESEKLEAKKESPVVSHQLSVQENKNDGCFRKSVSVKKNVAQKVFASVKKEMPKTIDTTDLPNSRRNRKLWNETHEIAVVQEIKPEEIVVQSQKKAEQLDTLKATAQNSISNLPTKRQEEKIIAQIPFKTSKNERQILKMLAWASGKILGEKRNDSNFDIAIGFVEVSHKKALTNN